jgi:hypothetical protein
MYTIFGWIFFFSLGFALGAYTMINTEGDRR